MGRIRMVNGLPKYPQHPLCAHCGAVVARQILRRSHEHFCCREHYMTHRRNGAGYVQDRCAQKRARKAVAAVCGPLPRLSVVHHHDSDTTNNALTNLALFASHSDHMKFHHGVNQVEPLWDGRALRSEAA